MARSTLTIDVSFYSNDDDVDTCAVHLMRNEAGNKTSLACLGIGKTVSDAMDGALEDLRDLRQAFVNLRIDTTPLDVESVLERERDSAILLLAALVIAAKAELKNDDDELGIDPASTQLGASVSDAEAFLATVKES